MPLSHDLQCIFVHIPKTGGTSIEHTLGLFGDWRIENRDCLFGLIQSPDLLAKTWGTRFLQHLSFTEISSLVTGSLLDTYFSFSWVRNPWDRMVSIYSNKDPDMLAFARNSGIFLDGLSFTEFVFQTRALTHVHLTDQASFITDIQGRMTVDFIGRFENFACDYQKLCDHLGISLPLQHKNASRHHAYQNYYNDQTLAEISRRYERDIDLFGYTF